MLQQGQGREDREGEEAGEEEIKLRSAPPVRGLEEKNGIDEGESHLGEQMHGPD